VLVSARHEFPTEWARFISVEASAHRLAPLTVPLRDEHYPLWSKASRREVRRVHLYAQLTETAPQSIVVSAGSPVATAELTADPQFGKLLIGELPQQPCRQMSAASRWVQPEHAGRPLAGHYLGRHGVRCGRTDRPQTYDRFQRQEVTPGKTASFD